MSKRELTHKEKVKRRALREEIWESLGFFLIMLVAAVFLGVVVHPGFGMFVGLVGVIAGLGLVAIGWQSSEVAIDAGRYQPEKRGR